MRKDSGSWVMGYDSLCCTAALTCNFSYSDAMEIKKKIHLPQGVWDDLLIRNVPSTFIT